MQGPGTVGTVGFTNTLREWEFFGRILGRRLSHDYTYIRVDAVMKALDWRG